MSVLGQLRPGTVAPAIEGSLTNQKAFSLGQAVKKGPVFVYFTSTGCPVAEVSNPYFDRIATALKKTPVTFVAVVNNSVAKTRAWASKYKLKFDAFPDEKYKTIKAYKIVKAPGFAIIGKDGKILQYWNGWSAPTMMDAIAKACRLAGVRPPTIDLRGAPAEVEAG